MKGRGANRRAWVLSLLSIAIVGVASLSTGCGSSSQLAPPTPSVSASGADAGPTAAEVERYFKRIHPGMRHLAWANASMFLASQDRKESKYSLATFEYRMAARDYRKAASHLEKVADSEEPLSPETLALVPPALAEYAECVRDLNRIYEAAGYIDLEVVLARWDKLEPRFEEAEKRLNRALQTLYADLAAMADETGAPAPQWLKDGSN